MDDNSLMSAVRTWSIAALVTLVIFLLLDFVFSSSLLPHPDATDSELPAELNPYLEGDQGWYELKPNFDGMYAWGSTTYSVATDAQGFRRKDSDVFVEEASVVFLGDSFTFGINGEWQESFVGMFAQDSQQQVINTGVSSYSPTAYLYQYKKLVAQQRVMPGHRVVVGLDISDVQDEAKYWVDGPIHPVKRNFRASPDPADAHVVRNRMRFSIMLYRLARYGIGYYRPQPKDVYTRDRSAITWQDWAKLDSGSYAPLGVAEGLSRIQLKLRELAGLVNKQGGTMYLLVYPWPAQIKFDSQYSWVEFANQTCIDIDCAGVIDAGPGFFAVKHAADNGDGDQPWYERLFVLGDVHYNTAGNRLVADALIDALAVDEVSLR